MNGLKVCRAFLFENIEIPKSFSSSICSKSSYSKGIKLTSYEHLASLKKKNFFKNFAPFNIELSALYLPSQYEELQFSHQGTRCLRLTARGVLTDARTVRSGARGQAT